VAQMLSTPWWRCATLGRMAIEIRTTTRDEFAPVVDAMSAAFLERPDVAAIAAQVRDLWDPDRTWAAFDGDRVCGTFRSWPTELTLPGLGTLPAAAVAGVTVLPTHRRQGILTRLAAAEHDALVERGEAVGLLYAAEYAIYGRFGYGPATRFGTWTVDFTRSRMLHDRADPGRMELVTPTPAIADELGVFYDEWRRSRPGEIGRRPYSWGLRLGLLPEPWGRPFKGFYALHRDTDGRLDGFIRYRNHDTWEDNLPKNRLEVTDLFGAGDAVESALWSYLASVDLVTSVKAEGRSPSDHLPWLLQNPRAAILSGTVDGMWVRLFDVPRALAARAYEQPGSIVLEVIDERAAGGVTRLLLDGSPDGATCRITDRSPDLTVPVAALGAVFLGAHDLRDVARRTGVDEHRDGALAEAARMFRTAREPWTSTFF
jgi:predicted acetyltransferase